MRFQLTAHSRHVMVERGLRIGWIRQALRKPALVETHEDGTRHFLACIAEYGGRVLRVVVNPKTDPPALVTAFFDRRMKGRLP